MKGKLAKLGHDIWKARTVYLLILPVVVYMLLFKYWPMYWLKISLYDYKIYKGFDGSKFVGFANFIKLFKAKDFWQMSLLRKATFLYGGVRLGQTVANYWKM